MTHSPKYSPQDLTSIVGETLRSVCPVVQSIDGETPLLGGQAVVDSMGFVMLLVALEGRLGDNLDLSGSFMELGDRDGDANPFRSVGSLAAHISECLSPRAGGARVR